MKQEGRVVCIGEILWDALPSGLYLGGAPLNVCYHLNQLGVTADICSKVGADRLGKEALRKIAQKGMTTDYIQRKDKAETGFVEVEVSPDGEPSYEFVEPAAWDFITLSDALKEWISQSWGLVYGSLAQRNEQSRQTIRELLQYDITKILDLNLRPPYIDRQVVEYALSKADIIKMNEEELQQLKQWFVLPGSDDQSLVAALTQRYSASVICVTRGARGAVLWQDSLWSEHKGYRAAARDSVGAGDAFLAALIKGIRNGRKGRSLLAYANAAGSVVAQRNGATPKYDISRLEEIVATDEQLAE